MRGPLTLVQDSWTLFRHNAKLLVSIYLVPMVASVVLGAAMAYRFPSDGPGMEMTTPAEVALFAVLFIALILASLIGSLALVKAISQPAGATVSSSYQYALKHVLSFVVLSFMVGIVVSLGFVFFIIPGIILGVWFAFAQFVFVDEGLRGVEAMKASRAHVRGQWWTVFGRLAAVIALSLIVYIPLSGLIALIAPGSDPLVEETLLNVVNLVVVPWMVAYMYLLYQDARKAHSIEAV